MYDPNLGEIHDNLEGIFPPGDEPPLDFLQQNLPSDTGIRLAGASIPTSSVAATNMTATVVSSKQVLLQNKGSSATASSNLAMVPQQNSTYVGAVAGPSGRVFNGIYFLQVNIS